MTLRSQKGSGTTAELWLPVAKTSPLPVQPPETAPATARHQLTILAVDDDALVLMNTVAMLEDLGHTVAEAYSGSEALEILRGQEAFDLVVTDQAMPKMTGVELAHIIKAEWPNMPILLATGYSDRLPGDNLGLPRLTKPFSQRELGDAVARVNSSQQQADRVVSLRPQSKHPR